jgi:ubiquinone/menaquinone biosynthesis C-methylase UbiE
MPIFETIFSIGPLRQLLWRCWYPILTKRLRNQDILFLNYAFHPSNPINLTLDPADELNRACIQLYHHVGSQIDLKHKTVLEISCGHGGGASWISRTQTPASYIGIDLNPLGIDFCQARHPIKGLHFQQGDAQQLPFPEQSMDAVINIEASHCYPDFTGFLAEVVRVLKPGGHLLYADFRFRESEPEWVQTLENSKLTMRATHDISADVLRGMDINVDRNQELIRQCLPKPLHSLGLDFAGVPGSRIYEALKARRIIYRSWCLQLRDAEEI